GAWAAPGAGRSCPGTGGPRSRSRRARSGSTRAASPPSTAPRRRTRPARRTLAPRARGSARPDERIADAELPLEPELAQGRAVLDELADPPDVRGARDLREALLVGVQ